MSKSNRRKQKNGRERGSAGNGLGPHQEVSPLARGTVTKTKRQHKDRADRREKSHGWSQD